MIFWLSYYLGVIYLKGNYKDIDAMIIVRNSRNPFEESLKLKKMIRGPYEFHVINIEDFERDPRCRGLALGYVILSDKVNIEEKIRRVFIHGVLVDI